MAYASGKHALAICDRCGWQYPYLSMKTEWDHARVCPECYEPKHPQLDPIQVPIDAEVLWKPRPDVPLPQSGLGKVTTTNLSTDVISETGTNAMVFEDDPNIGSKFNGEEGAGALGDLTVSTN
jgi:NAD-dependent SIR2 family protein deacetylase|tara:strand:+ start:343 stop:711 length:369 start_codon:yes stop_codon:yes gene_type:complete